MTPEERRTEAFKALITKARDNELTSSEIVDCLRGIAKLNHPQGNARIELHDGGSCQLYLSSWDRHPSYRGKCIEDALTAAYDDITRIIAEDESEAEKAERDLDDAMMPGGFA